MVVLELAVFDDIADSVVVFICYRLFFALKRVEIQINPKYESVISIVNALKAQFRFERMLLALFIIGDLVQLVIMILSIYGFTRLIKEQE